MDVPALSPQLFAILAALVEERSGLHYGTGDAGLFSDKLTTRAQEAGFESLLDYYYFLRYDPDGQTELESLVEALVVHETYFFREVEALVAAIDHIVVPAIERYGRARIWSAACSTGEEPISLAILLAQRELDAKVDILATDISHRALEKARRGRFRLRSLRQHAADRGGNYFERCGDELVVVPALARKIDFRQLNLLDDAAIAKLGQFDLILCRNVLIYFSEQLVARVSGTLTRALRPGGGLLVGVSESLLRFSTELVCEERGGAFLYLRPE